MHINLEVYLPFRGRNIYRGVEEVPAGISLAALLACLGFADQPGLAVLVNGRYHPDEARLAPGDEVAILRRSEGG